MVPTKVRLAVMAALAWPAVASAQAIDLSHGGPVTVTALGGIDWDQQAQTDYLPLTSFEESSHSHGGQGHDRIHGDNLIPGVSNTIAMSCDTEGDVDIGITAGQKMISAMSGSLLTSLLSKFLIGWFTF